MKTGLCARSVMLVIMTGENLEWQLPFAMTGEHQFPPFNFLAKYICIVWMNTFTCMYFTI